MIKYIIAVILLLSLFLWFVYYKYELSSDSKKWYTDSTSKSMSNDKEFNAWEVKHSGWWDTP